MDQEPLYHTGNQSAAALLPPVARSLKTLSDRLDQYATRLKMPEGDRELVEMANRILKIAQEDFADLLSDVADRVGESA